MPSDALCIFAPTFPFKNEIVFSHKVFFPSANNASFAVSELMSITVSTARAAVCATAFPVASAALDQQSAAAPTPNPSTAFLNRPSYSESSSLGFVVVDFQPIVRYI